MLTHCAGKKSTDTWGWSAAQSRRMGFSASAVLHRVHWHRFVQRPSVWHTRCGCLKGSAVPCIPPAAANPRAVGGPIRAPPPLVGASLCHRLPAHLFPPGCTMLEFMRHPHTLAVARCIIACLAALGPSLLLVVLLLRSVVGSACAFSALVPSGLAIVAPYAPPPPLVLLLRCS